MKKTKKIIIDKKGIDAIANMLSYDAGLLEKVYNLRGSCVPDHLRFTAKILKNIEWIAVEGESNESGE